jgi:hypothetical protein
LDRGRTGHITCELFCFFLNPGCPFCKEETGQDSQGEGEEENANRLNSAAFSVHLGPPQRLDRLENEPDLWRVGDKLHKLLESSGGRR